MCSQVVNGTTFAKTMARDEKPEAMTPMIPKKRSCQNNNYDKGWVKAKSTLCDLGWYHKRFRKRMDKKPNQCKGHQEEIPFGIRVQKHRLSILNCLLTNELRVHGKKKY